MSNDQQDNEALFLTMANVIAQKYGFELKIDYETQSIDFVGDVSEENELKCAEELTQLFEKDIGGTVE